MCPKPILSGLSAYFPVWQSLRPHGCAIASSLAAEAEISDDVLNEFIADEQAFFESYAGKTFAEADPQFALARSICTDRCAAKALVYFSAPSAGIS